MTIRTHQPRAWNGASANGDPHDIEPSSLCSAPSEGRSETAEAYLSWCGLFTAEVIAPSEALYLIFPCIFRGNGYGSRTRKDLEPATLVTLMGVRFPLVALALEARMRSDNLLGASALSEA